MCVCVYGCERIYKCGFIFLEFFSGKRGIIRVIFIENKQLSKIVSSARN